MHAKSAMALIGRWFVRADAVFILLLLSALLLALLLLFLLTKRLLKFFAASLTRQILMPAEGAI